MTLKLDASFVINKAIEDHRIKGREKDHELNHIQDIDTWWYSAWKNMIKDKCRAQDIHLFVS